MDKHCILCALAMPMLMAACGKPGNRTDATAGEKRIVADSVLQTVETGTVGSRILNEELLLNGRVGFDMERINEVYSMLSGSVERVYAEAGDYVNKGDLLASIRSEEAAEMEKELREAEHVLVVSERNLKATEEMVSSGVLSERDLLSARKEAAEARAEAERVRKRLEIYPTAEGTYYLIKSPVSGFVTERTVNPGMQIRPDREDALFTLAALDQVWVTGDVYEGDISKIHEGMPVRITTLAYGEKEFRGVIDRVYQVLEDESKTMSVRIKLDNKEKLLKPGMFANIYVQTNREGEALPCVEAHAVIFENGRQYVVAVENGEMSLRQVAVAKHTATHCYLKTGVAEGDTIVKRNALLVFNALK